QPRPRTVHQRWRPARRVLGKNGKVVVIPEQLGELVRLIRYRLEPLRPRGASDAEVVPEVLRACPPLVHRGVGGIDARLRERLATSAVTSYETVAGRRPAAEGPVADALATLLKLADCASEG